MHNCEPTPNKLFNRPQDEAYLEEWSKLLAQPKGILEEVKESPFVVFRIYNEWFGLSALVFSEIVSDRPINVIPYKSEPSLLGIVNLRGRLCLCISLHRLFEMALDHGSSEDRRKSKVHNPRMITLSNKDEIWAFPVDEVDSVYQIDLSKMTNVPINLLHSKKNFLKGIISIGNKKINVIDEEILFASLYRRSL